MPVYLFSKTRRGLLMFDEGGKRGDDEFRHIGVLLTVLELFQQQEGSIEEEFALHHARDDLM